MQVLHDFIVVEPHYDSDKLGSLYIPDSYQNPEPQQGKVIACGPSVDWSPGNLLVYHPFTAIPVPGEKTQHYIRDRDVVCSIEDGIPMPKKGEVMIRPDWDSKYKANVGGLIYIPVEVSDAQYEPVKFGTIELIHYDGLIIYTDYRLSRGDYIIIPPQKGSEIGTKDGVFYFIPIDEILAKVNNDPDSRDPS